MRKFKIYTDSPIEEIEADWIYYEKEFRKKFSITQYPYVVDFINITTEQILCTKQIDL